MTDINIAFYVVRLLNEIKKLFDSTKKHSSIKQQDSDINIMAERFIQLVKKHDVHHNQIPLFFNYGIEHVDFANTERLLTKLTPEILKMVCTDFAVRLNWLLGVDNIIYEKHYFYQQPKAYKEFLAQLTANNPHLLIAKLVLSTTSLREEDALLILEEYIPMDNELRVRYHLCGSWNSKYWKSKVDLTACVAMTIKQGIDIRGWEKAVSIDSFCAGEGFITDLYELPWAFKRDWLLRRRLKRWHPDEWLYNPDTFLEGINEGVFGKINALAGWLNHFDEGYLETGYIQANAREKFASALASYQN